MKIGVAPAMSAASGGSWTAATLKRRPGAGEPHELVAGGGDASADPRRARS